MQLIRMRLHSSTENNNDTVAKIAWAHSLMRISVRILQVRRVRTHAEAFGGLKWQILSSHEPHLKHGSFISYSVSCWARHVLRWEGPLAYIPVAQILEVTNDLPFLFSPLHQLDRWISPDSISFDWPGIRTTDTSYLIIIVVWRH